MTHGFTTYESQVAAIKRWMREGLCEKIGTWQQGAKHGDMWFGKGYGFHWWFHTQGRILVPGSFRVKCVGIPTKTITLHAA